MAAARTALGALAEQVEDAGVPYVLIGGHAVNAWLEPRFTADVDLTVQAGAAELARLGAVLQAAGYRREARHGAEQASGPDFERYASADRLVVIEIQAAKTALQREVIRRGVVGTEGLRVATPEDLIVLKLIADRPKDQGDLAGLVRLPGLDWAYVEGWAEQWGVLDRLRALRASG